MEGVRGGVRGGEERGGEERGDDGVNVKLSLMRRETWEELIHLSPIFLLDNSLCLSV